MTEQETYIERQEASGIEVGDTVRVVRKAKSFEGGWVMAWTTAMDPSVRETLLVEEVNNRGVHLDGICYFPYFVLEIVKKANGDVPNVIAETEITGECTMKTQEIYSYVVTEDKFVKDAKTGQVERIGKDILGVGVVAAYDEANAKLKAMAETAKNATLDAACHIDEVEVLVRPFCG